MFLLRHREQKLSTYKTTPNQYPLRKLPKSSVHLENCSESCACAANITSAQHNAAHALQNIAPVQQNIGPVQQNMAPVQQNLASLENYPKPVSTEKTTP